MLEDVIRKILDEGHIEYIESGKNWKEGNINIQCPFCGPDDPSFHCGLNYVEKYYYCWRNPLHKGSLFSVIKKLTKERFKDYYNELKEAIGDVNSQENLYSSSPHSDCVHLPFSVCDITPDTKHYSYLSDTRGFGEKTPLLLDLFKLQRIDNIKDRFSIFIPYYEKGQLVTYNIRVMGNADIRYRALNRDNSMYSSQETLFGYDVADHGGHMLFITEGTFDCMKVSVFGHGYGISSVALSGKNITTRQLQLLSELSERFDRIYLLLDNDTGIEKLHVLSKIMKYTTIQPAELPHTLKDPGEFTETLFHQWRASV